MGELRQGTAQGAPASRVGVYARRNVVAFAALFVALSGSAYAAGEIGSGDIAKKAVHAKHIAKKAVRAKHIRKNSIRTQHVKKNGLRTVDVRGLDKTIKKLNDGLLVTGGYIGQLLSDIDALKARVSDLEADQLAVQNSIDKIEQDVAAFKTATDGRLDSLCAEADRNNQETRDLKSALDIPAITTLGVSFSNFSLPDYNPAECQG